MEGIPVSLEKKEDIQYPEIAAEILKRSEEDQKMRTALHDGGAWDESIDLRNTQYIKEVIQKIGYPTISKVGKEASHMAWLLIQHAPHDLVFQSECLSLLKTQVQGEILLGDIAFLEDRIRMRKGVAQRYGTQFYTDLNGVYDVYPIEDPEHLDERREAFGLGSFDDYREEIMEVNKDFVDSRKQDSAKI